jgi:protein SCO1/2
MTGPPLLLGAIFVLLWQEPLRAVLRRPAALVAPAAAAAVFAASAAGAFTLLVRSVDLNELPFPAEALRTAHPAPQLRLLNQHEEIVDVSELRGHVVVLTAVYASCPHTCPLILAQARGAMEQLSPEERNDVRVVAVTMDPGHDTPEILAQLGEIQSLHAPLYQLVTGEPAEVERVLDALEVARRRDPETGIIEHANIFVILDRDGVVAYRFGLGDRQARWLLAALRILLDEPPHVG